MGRRLGRPSRLPPYVHGFVDRHGKSRHYLRCPGFKSVPLPGLPWSPEFMATHEVALATASPQHEIGASRTAPGTINALVVSYYKSSAWCGELEEETRKTRKRIIERFRQTHGDKRVALLRQDHLKKMLDEIEKPSAKRHWLKAIRGLLRSAVPSRRCSPPMETIPRGGARFRGCPDGRWRVFRSQPDEFLEPKTGRRDGGRKSKLADPSARVVRRCRRTGLPRCGIQDRGQSVSQVERGAGGR